MVLLASIVVSLCVGALLGFYARRVGLGLLGLLPYHPNEEYIREEDTANTHEPTGVVLRIGSKRHPMQDDPLRRCHVWLLREGEEPYRLPLAGDQPRAFEILVAKEANVACVLVLTHETNAFPPVECLLKIGLPAEGSPLGAAVVETVWHRVDPANAPWVSFMFALSPDGQRLLVDGYGLDGGERRQAAFTLDLGSRRFTRVEP